MVTLKSGAPLSPQPAHISVGREIMAVTGQASKPAPTTSDPARMEHTITVTRAQGGSPASSHDRGDTIQPCFSVTAENVVDVARKLLSPPFTTLPEGVTIDETSFSFEKQSFLALQIATNIVAKPEATMDLLGSLQKSYGFRVFYNSETRKIELRSIAGFAAEGQVTRVYDDTNIVKGSLSIKEDPRESISAVYFYTRPFNFADTSKSNDKWVNTDVFINQAIQAPDQRGEERAMHIYSRWITPSAARSVAERYLRAGGENEVDIEFQTAHTHQVRLGQNSRSIPPPGGLVWRSAPRELPRHAHCQLGGEAAEDLRPKNAFTAPAHCPPVSSIFASESPRLAAPMFFSEMFVFFAPMEVN